MIGPDRAFLRRQPLLVASLVVLAFFGVLYAVPAELRPLQPGDVDHHVNLILAALVVAALAGNLRAGSSRGERRYWAGLALAFGSWLLTEAIFVALPHLQQAVGAALAGDVFYLLFYLFALLAAEEQPHRPPAGRPMDEAVRFVNRAGATVFLLALLTYFVLIPSALNPAEYRTWLPSLALWATLDLTLVARYLNLGLAARDQPWRSHYRLLALAFASWGLIDLMDVVAYAGGPRVPSGTVVDVLWFGPFALVVAAVLRCRSATPPAGWLQTIRCQLEPPARRLRLRLVAYVFALPAVHFAGYQLGVLDPLSRRPREICVVVFLLLAAALALLATTLQAALARSQHQIETARRMAAIARLTGGLTHELNNLLTVIFMHTSLLRDELDEDDPRRTRVEQIADTARRAASFTEQLVTFSRSRTPAAEVLDLNRTLQHTARFLEPLLGEDVELALEPAPDLWPVRIDPTTVEEIVMHLGANARDAMPGGGRLRLVTANRDLRRGPRDDLGLAAGRYAALTVGHAARDGGRRPVSHLVSPFFATGLESPASASSLAKVHDLLDPFGGRVLVAEEPGGSIAVHILLPHADERPEDAVVEDAEPPLVNAGI
ncbi:MAG: hypothetical protein D6696_08860 [Acidobacteria bacterium]|nr:MAG: hypothetical protein D6696_08860 [Acidobacteriota bacterium]